MRREFRSKFIAVITCMMMVFCMLPQASFAEDNVPDGDVKVTEDGVRVEVTDSVTEFSDSIQTDSGEAFIEIEPDEVETYEESDLYTVNESPDGTVEAVSIYSSKRLVIYTTDEIADTFGAERAAFYKNRYVLVYDSEEATRDAYEQLQAVYGDSVIIDVPIKIPAASAAGWGTDYMELDDHTAYCIDQSYSGTVTVAVLDSGVNGSHIIFDETAFVNGYNFVEGSENWTDDNGHGTAVAGIIAESTPSSVRIMPVKVLDSSGNGHITDIENGLDYACAHGADVVNMSFEIVIANYDETYLDSLYGWAASMDGTMSEYAGRGVIFIAASGNEGLDIDTGYCYPAVSQYTISAGAINNSGTLWGRSNYGSSLDYVAPGYNVSVASGSDNVSFVTKSGTSFACPYISAAAALVKLENPSAGKSAVKSYLDSISVDLGAEGRDVYCGNGCPKFAAYSGGSQGGDEPGGDEPGGNEPGGTEPEPVVVTINLAKSGKLSGLKNATYTGKAIYPSPVVTCEGKTLKRNTDYTVSYKNYRNVGTATVTVKGKGNYTGTLTGTFKILPKGTTISKLTRASKAITVNWKKQSTKMSTTLITGYQIQLATDSKFTKNKKTVTVQGYSKTSTKVTKLKAKTRYYVRIRTYKSINGTKYYSLWSAAKYITTN